MVRWEEIPLYDEPETLQSFMLSLNRDGSAYYIYKSVPFFPSLLFVQVDFTYPAQHQQGLVGARPFFTLGNYTYRSPFIPSSYNNWYVLSRGST